MIIISTYPNKKSLSKIAAQLVSNRLAACVNMVPISSTFLWKGKIEKTSEYLALFKTTKKNKNKLKTAIQRDHPYNVPEIAEIEITSINKPYLNWLINSTN